MLSSVSSDLSPLFYKPHLPLSYCHQHSVFLSTFCSLGYGFFLFLSLFALTSLSLSYCLCLSLVHVLFNANGPRAKNRTFFVFVFISTLFCFSFETRFVSVTDRSSVERQKIRFSKKSSRKVNFSSKSDGTSRRRCLRLRRNALSRL